jgi:hypothetical protein
VPGSYDGVNHRYGNRRRPARKDDGWRNHSNRSRRMHYYAKRAVIRVRSYWMDVSYLNKSKQCQQYKAYEGSRAQSPGLALACSYHP